MVFLIYSDRLAIDIRQIITINKLEYYYFKSLNTVLILLVPLALIGWTLLLKSVTRHPASSAVFLSAGFVLLLPLTIGIEPLNTSNLDYLKGKRAFTDNENRFIYNSMAERGETPTEEREEDVILYIPNEQGHNIIGTNIIRSIQHVDDCDGEIFYSLLLNDEGRLFNNIARCQHAPLKIITRSDSANHIQSLIAEYGVGSNVKVLAVD
jgi:hypothetical protein